MFILDGGHILRFDLFSCLLSKSNRRQNQKHSQTILKAEHGEPGRFQKPLATWTAMPTAETSCATCSVFFQVIPPPKALSGTTTRSPGCSATSIAPPLNIPPLPPTTVPSARTTKIALLLAIVVGPPACCKYQPALFP